MILFKQNLEQEVLNSPPKGYITDIRDVDMIILVSMMQGGGFEKLQSSFHLLDCSHGGSEGQNKCYFRLKMW